MDLAIYTAALIEGIQDNEENFTNRTTDPPVIHTAIYHGLLEMG